MLALQEVGDSRGRANLSRGGVLPPDRRPRDKDNMSGAFKAGQDGLADAWKINDKRIDPTYKVSDQILGMVKVKLLGEKP
jgi:hypothetical protein